MGGSDGLLCAGEELVETVLTTGQDRTPGARLTTVLLALTHQLEISQSVKSKLFSPPTQTSSTRFGFETPGMRETFSKLAYRRRARDI